jgi:hypothetical protein
MRIILLLIALKLLQKIEIGLACRSSHRDYLAIGGVGDLLLMSSKLLRGVLAGVIMDFVL